MPFVTHNFLEDMALVMCVAALATVLCQWLHQPLVVGYLIAGMVVGPHVPGVYANTERVRLVSDLGVTILVFAIGLEFKFRQLVRLAPTAGLVALIQAASMIWLGYLVGRLMGWTPWERRDPIDFRRRHRGQSVRRGAGGVQSARTGLRRGAVRRRGRDLAAGGADHFGERRCPFASRALNRRGPPEFVYRSGGRDRTDYSSLRGA